MISDIHLSNFICMFLNFLFNFHETIEKSIINKSIIFKDIKIHANEKKIKKRKKSKRNFLTIIIQRKNICVNNSLCFLFLFVACAGNISHRLKVLILH